MVRVPVSATSAVVDVQAGHDGGIAVEAVTAQLADAGPAGPRYLLAGDLDQALQRSPGSSSTSSDMDRIAWATARRS
jgi:hypothetical protein